MTQLGRQPGRVKSSSASEAEVGFANLTSILHQYSDKLSTTLIVYPDCLSLPKIETLHTPQTFSRRRADPVQAR